MELLLHPYAQVLAWALVHFLWQGALIGLVAFGLMRVPRFSAATRYTIGVVALGAMLAAPIATAAYLASGTDVSMPRRGQTMIVNSSSPAGFGAGTRGSDKRVSRANLAPTGESRSRPGSRATGVAIILAIWCAGVMLLSFRLASSWLAVRRLVGEATRPVSPEIHTLVRRVAGRLALDRVVRVCESSAVVVPVMIGWLKPVVLLPASTISGLAPAQVEALIAHELAHVRRHDYLVNLLQAVVETLLFYHPAVWLVSSHVRTEREHCCDDLAVGVCDRLVYVTALADLAALNAVPRIALAATGGSLLGRVRRILGGGSENRLPVSGSLSALFVLLVAGILVPISLVSARDAAPAVLPAFAQAPTQATTPAATTAPRPSPTQTTTRGSGNYVWSSSRDKLAIKWTGAFRLADDDKDIEWIEPGQSVEVSDDGWVFTTGVVLKGKSDGTIERSYRRNGFVRPYDPEGREYLATALLRVVRKSGFGAESRVARFLKQGGIEAVFTEITQLEGDYARRLYYTELFKQAKLSPADLTRVANQAATTISSDYELATLLKAAAKLNVGDENALVALIEATRTLNSDYEHHQALSALVPVKPTTKVASAALASAVNLQSDYERASFLIDFARRGGLTSTTRPAFMDLVTSMHSSYEQSRVLQTVMTAPDVPADVVADARKASTSVGSDYEHRQVLMSSMAATSVSPRDAGGVIESAASIRSDNEKANVLVALAKKGGVTAETAGPFFSVVSGISSSYEQRRVIDTVGATPKLDDGVLSPLLKAAASVKGDYDRAEILVRVAKNHTLTTVTRPLYLAAADGIRSDYDQTRVLAELVRSEKTIK